MSTCIFYVDESGDGMKFSIPIKSGETPLFVLSGISLEIDNWRGIDREYLALKNRYFKKEIAKSGIRPEHWEIKGSHLCAPRNSTNRRNHFFIKEVIDMGQRYQIKLFAIVVKKNAGSAVSPHSIYTSALQYLVERFSCFISESSTCQNGIIIADSRMRGLDKKVAVSHSSFIFGHETGKLFTNIIEAPLFADSSLTVGLQLADIFGGLIFANNYYHHCGKLPGAPSYEHIRRYWEALKASEFKSKNSYKGYCKFGFRVIDHKDAIISIP